MLYNNLDKVQFFDIPDCLFPVPYSLFSAPCSLFPVPCSLKSQTYVPHLFYKCYNSA
ncbi:MAG: hypothetical protein F6K26_27615 [Moorea sp. SIO2I5]|nr:hypothetical protein [Moorena sp. SIO2I5]